MWTGSTILSWTPCPPTTATGRKQPPKYLPFIVSKLNQKPRPRNNTHCYYSEDNDNEDENEDISTQDIGGLGHAVASALNTDNNPILGNQNQQRQSNCEEKMPRGSDVLWALQKATAQKTKKKKKSNSSSSLSPLSQSRCRNATKKDESTADYSNVRPLYIKSDWSTRLDELEKQLQQLTDA